MKLVYNGRILLEFAWIFAMELLGRIEKGLIMFDPVSPLKV